MIALKGHCLERRRRNLRSVVFASPKGCRKLEGITCPVISRLCICAPAGRWNIPYHLLSFVAASSAHPSTMKFCETNPSSKFLTVCQSMRTANGAPFCLTKQTQIEPKKAAAGRPSATPLRPGISVARLGAPKCNEGGWPSARTKNKSK
jgi:hypothetical protein